MWAPVFHISYVQILHNEPFNKNRGTIGSISDWVLKNFILWQREASAEKICQIVIISHNSAQHEKWTIFIVCYITNHQNPWISKFILHH